MVLNFYVVLWLKSKPEENWSDQINDCSCIRTLIRDDYEIAVTYFRAGYGPNDYPTNAEWDARALIEQSYSIKCPNAAYHLVGSKKIQQVLAEPGMLEKFMNPTHSSILRSSFTGLYPLDQSPEGLEAYKKAIEEPDKYVLKPQREGGGISN